MLCAREDSNFRPSPCKGAALAKLSYARRWVVNAWRLVRDLNEARSKGPYLLTRYMGLSSCVKRSLSQASRFPPFCGSALCAVDHAVSAAGFDPATSIV